MLNLIPWKLRIKIFKQILCFVIIGMILLPAAEAKITTSFPVLTLIVQELVLAEIPIRTLTPSGEDAHHFELSPKTLIALQNQDLLIVNGLGFEHWLPTLKSKLSPQVHLCIAAEKITPLTNSGIDPHAWHHPDHLLSYVDTITGCLMQKYPQKKSVWENRATLLKTQISKWKNEAQKRLEALPKNFLIITGHNSFAYMAAAFHFRSIALLGNHEGESLSPKQLIQKIRDLQTMTPRAFFGEGHDQDRTLKEWAQKTNSLWGGELWGDHWVPSSTKVTLMEYLNHNINTLLKISLAKTKIL